MSEKNDRTLINLFARHKVLANLLMFLMLILGGWGIYKLNTQFLPNIEINVITVAVPWQGASASDIERSIIVPLERELDNVSDLKTMRSVARTGSGRVILEFEQNTDMALALQQVQEKVAAIRSLPEASEDPQIELIENYNAIARVVISGGASRQNLRSLAYQYRRELLQRGIAKVEIKGLPEQQLAVKITPSQLERLDRSLPDIAKLIEQYSQDIPLGEAGQKDAAKELRMMKAVRSIEDLAAIPFSNSSLNHVQKLGDVADITKEKMPGEITVYNQGKPAVELRLLRTPEANALEMAEILHQWQASKSAHLDKGVNIKLYDQKWKMIKQRINLMVKNGLTGLLFIFIILFLFLNYRVAFWVGVGIPVSFMATFFILYLFGASINMVSLFAMIMALGIIVDDTIVVGEDAYVHHQSHYLPQSSAIQGAKRMIVPVLASSLTTISAFLPLMLVGDTIGQILFSIPLVVVCIILASLMECFLVLPKHLASSFANMHSYETSRFRQKFNAGFCYIRDQYFIRWVKYAIKGRWVVFALAASSLLISLGMIIGGHVPFTFFKSPPGNVIKLNATFVAGTHEDKVRNYLRQAERQLYQIAEKRNQLYPNEPDLVNMTTMVLGATADIEGDQSFAQGENVGHLNVELSMPKERTITNNELINRWHQKLKPSPALEKMVIAEPNSGPPGDAIDIRLTNASPVVLKQAAVKLVDRLNQFKGVLNISDDLPYGREQWLFELKPLAIAQGLTNRMLARQISSAYAGLRVQSFTEGQDEIEVRVMLTDQKRHYLNPIHKLPITLPNGDSAPLEKLANIHSKQGFDVLKHQNGQLAVSVTADVDNQITNANKVLNALQKGILQKLKQKYKLDYTFGGRSEDQTKTFTDMLLGMIIGLFLIYIILAAVFSSYGWPFLVMIMIPFGLSGAVFGHWLLDYDMTILSLFGLFGLAGIVVNDSIILVSFYQYKRQEGLNCPNAIIEAARSRFRAVLLTSMTTISGLTPLLFETSMQAKFLIPMAISIVFGLGFSTFLILLVLPALLSVYERA